MLMAPLGVSDERTGNGERDTRSYGAEGVERRDRTCPRVERRAKRQWPSLPACEPPFVSQHHAAGMVSLQFEARAARFGFTQSSELGAP